MNSLETMRLVKESLGIELDLEALQKFEPVLDSINAGMMSLGRKVELPLDTEPCFMNVIRASGSKVPK